MVKTERTEHQVNNFYGGLNVPRSGLRKVLVNPRRSLMKARKWNIKELK